MFDEEDYKEDIKSGLIPISKLLIFIVVPILAISLIFGAWSIIGRYIDTNADRVIFKESLTYNEGVLDDLAKYKFEMITAEDEIEKKAIAQLVVERFANYDETKIETDDLKQFLIDCRNLDLEDY